MLQPDGKPHLTVFMHVCHDRHATLPCPALSCPTLRPGSARLSQARLGSTGTCLFWVGLAWLTCRFFRLAAVSLLSCLPALQ